MKTIEPGVEIDAPRRKVGRPCATCKSGNKAEIERLLMTREVTTEEISTRFGVSQGSLVRHRANHLPIATRVEADSAIAEAEGERATSLLEDASNLRRKALDILAEAESSGKLLVCLQAIREAGRLIELQGKLMGQIDTSTTVNISLAPVLVSLQSAIMTALAPFPDARRAVVMALGALTDRQPLQIEGQAG